MTNFNKNLPGLLAITSSKEVAKIQKQLNKIAKNAEANMKKSAADFAKLPRAKKVVALAEDVLKQMSAKSYSIVPGSYVETNNPDEAFDSEACQLPLSTVEGLSCLVNSKCTVCAKGALFLASAIKTNKMTTNDVVNTSEEGMRQRLVHDEEIFDNDTFDLLEIAFEEWGICDYNNDFTDETNAKESEIGSLESEIDDIEFEIDTSEGDKSEIAALTKKKKSIQSAIEKLRKEIDKRRDIEQLASTFGTRLFEQKGFAEFRNTLESDDGRAEIVLASLMLGLIKNKGVLDLNYLPKLSDVKKVFA